MNIILVAAVIVNGVITGMDGSMLTIRTCEGPMTVDANAAVAAGRIAPLEIGKNIVITGELEGNVLMATAIANKRMTCIE